MFARRRVVKFKGGQSAAELIVRPRRPSAIRSKPQDSQRVTAACAPRLRIDDSEKERGSPTQNDRRVQGRRTSHLTPYFP
jgi:hypothetical protein